MQRTDVVATELALAQCGAFAAWQLDEAHVSKPARKRRLQSGTWIRRFTGIYTLAGVAPSYEQDLWVAWLAAGRKAVVSFESAAEVHHMPNVVRGRLILTVPHSCWRRLPGVFVHQISDILPTHRMELPGLPPVTTPARTAVDLAAVVSLVRLLHIVEDSVHQRLTTYTAIGECAASVARRGKPGVLKLARVLDRLTRDGVVGSQSKAERCFFEALRAAGVEVPVSQYPFPGRQFVSGCTDGGYPWGQLAVEIDSRRWHTRIRDVAHDRERDLEAARNGWQTLRFLAEHVFDDPSGVAETVRTVLDERRRLLAS